MPPRPKAIVVFRRIDNVHGETIVFWPTQCTRDTRRILRKEIRDLLSTVGFVRTHIAIEEEPVSMNDPDPVQFSDLINGQPPFFRHVKVRAGHVNSVFTSTHRYSSRQYRLLKKLFEDILRRLGIRVHEIFRS